MSARLPFIPAILFTMVFMTVGGPTALAESAIHQYFEGMRLRGLWVIAEEYALNQLKREQLPNKDRVQLTIELSQTLIAHGAAMPDQRAELWAEGERVIREAFGTSQEPEMRVQLPLLIVAQAETLSWEAQLSPDNTDLASAATSQLRIAAEQLQAVLREKFVEQRLYEELTQQLRLTLGKSVVLLAEMTPLNADRAHLWTVAVNALKPLTAEAAEPQVVLDASLLRARIARQVKEYERANKTLENLLNEVSPSNRDRVLAEQMRLRLAEGKPEDALEIIRTRWQINPEPSDELLATTVDALLAAWRIASSSMDVSLQNDLMSEARKTHDKTGGRWRQMTYVRLQEFDENSKLGHELADAVRAGRAAYHSEKFEEAISHYATAVNLAFQSGKFEQALEFAMTRASILLAQQQWYDASQAYHVIVDRFPSHTQAAQAHLLKCYALGRHYAESPSQLNREAYEGSLKEHIERFSSSPTVAEAMWMFATHFEQRLQWTDAIAQYRNIPKDNAHFDEACLRTTILYENILKRLRDLDGPVAEWEDNAVSEVKRLGNALPPSPAQWNVTQCQTGLRCAQLLLEHRDRYYADADVWLTRIDQTVSIEHTLARREEKPVESSWLQLSQAVSQLRIVSLAGQQKITEASQLLSNLGASDPLIMLGVLQGLSELGGKIDEDRRRELGQLQEKAVAEINASNPNLTPQQQQVLKECTAEAFVALGDLPEAANVYESLLTERPNDKRLIYKVISVYTQRGQKSDLEHAKKWWTKLERMETPGSTDWIKARVEVSKVMIQLDDTVSAKKLLGVTKALYPNLGTPDLKSEVEELLR